MTQESFWEVELSEDASQKLVVDWCRVHESQFPLLALLYSVPNGAPMAKRTAARFVATGLKKGVPDLCLPVPGKHDHGLYIEMKSKKGRIRPEQFEFIKMLGDLGYRVQICRRPEVAIQLLVGQVVENMSKGQKNRKREYEHALKVIEPLGEYVDIMETPGDEDLAGFRQEIGVFVDFLSLRCYPHGTRVRDEHGVSWLVSYYSIEDSVIDVGFKTWLAMEEL